METPIYTLDTSFFINGWTKRYKPAVFPGAWEEINLRLEDGRVLACYEVFDELQKKEDTLAKWVKDRRDFFRDPTEADTLKMKEIMAAFPNLASKPGNKADPWVVAQAILSNTTVVTDEQPQESCSDTRPPKMPFVCEHFEVAWITPCDFFEQLGIVFR